MKEPMCLSKNMFFISLFLSNIAVFYKDIGLLYDPTALENRVAYSFTSSGSWHLAVSDGLTHRSR